MKDREKNAQNLGDLEEMNLGWTSPRWIKELFQEACDKLGLRYGDAIQAAMIAFVYATPSRLREWAALTAKRDPGAPPAEFWRGFADTIDELLDEQAKRLRDMKRKRGESKKQ